MCDVAFLSRLVNSLKPLSIFPNKLHRRCLTGFEIASDIDVFSYFYACVLNLYIPEYSLCNSLSRYRVAQTFNLYCTLVQINI